MNGWITGSMNGKHFHAEKFLLFHIESKLKVIFIRLFYFY